MIDDQDRHACAVIFELLMLRHKSVIRDEPDWEEIIELVEVHREDLSRVLGCSLSRYDLCIKDVGLLSVSN